jgi:hypothetical protein
MSSFKLDPSSAYPSSTTCFQSNIDGVNDMMFSTCYFVQIRFVPDQMKLWFDTGHVPYVRRQKKMSGRERAKKCCMATVKSNIQKLNYLVYCEGIK